MRTSLIAPLSLGLAVTVAGCSWFGGGRNETQNHAPVIRSSADRTVTPTNSNAGTRTSENSTSKLNNQQVRQAQEKLQQLGLYKGHIDGIYGRQTVAAVDKFQSENGLPRNGQLTSTTEQRLQSAQANQPQNSQNQPQTAQQPAPNNQPANPQTSAVPPNQGPNNSQSPNANPSSNAPNNQPNH